MKQKSPVQGYIGVAGAGVGLYLVVDYFKENKKVAKLLEENNLDIKIVNRHNQVALLFEKKI